MKIELHILQNFAPSNLNRDDTGAPKDCVLGSHRRARISSQCQKRATRDVFRLERLVPEENLAVRTKRLAHQVAQVLEEQHGMSRDEALPLAMGGIEGVGLKRAATKKGEDAGEDVWKTEYLLFVPARVVAALAAVLYEHRDELSDLAAAAAEDAEGASKKKAKKKAKDAYPKAIRQKVEGLLASSSDCADLALFGRMIADAPQWNVDAACQVAHAISTNTVQMDFDFYTAVDDFKPDDTAGSDMMGTVQFNSSCFYRYAVLDMDSLRRNLDGNETLARSTANAFVRAFVTAVPSGKQNSMAAHNPPSYVLAVARKEGQPVSLSNAFLTPSRPKGDEDLVAVSIKQLERYFERMRGWMGDEVIAVSYADRDLDDREGVERAADIRPFFDRMQESSA